MMIEMQILENPPYDDTHEEVYRIQKRLHSLFADENYANIAQLAIDSIEKPGVSKFLYDWAIWAAAHRKDIARVELYLVQSLKHGIWFSEEILEDLLEDMKNSPQLRVFIGQHEKLHLEVSKKTEAQLLVRTPSKSRSRKKYPLILFLDGRHSDHTISQYYWKPALEKIDIVFASLRPSQIHGHGRYAWDDNDISLQEVRRAYELLQQRDDVDETQMIVSGMSQGAGIALQAIAQEIISARGFLTIAQALKPDNFFKSDLPSLIGKDLRGVIISGEKDKPRHPSHRRFHELAVAAGIDCEFFSFPDIGHEYPVDFSSIVIQSVKFILTG